MHGTVQNPAVLEGRYGPFVWIFLTPDLPERSKAMYENILIHMPFANYRNLKQIVRWLRMNLNIRISRELTIASTSEI